LPGGKFVWVRVEGEGPSLVDAQFITRRAVTEDDDTAIWDRDLLGLTDLTEPPPPPNQFN
jgi:hypothetical protein